MKLLWAYVRYIFHLHLIKSTFDRGFNTSNYEGYMVIVARYPTKLLAEGYAKDYKQYRMIRREAIIQHFTGEDHA